jgi:hypothetical protein
MGKKKKRMTPEERAAWNARADEQIRMLRQLIAKGRAELAARQAERPV